VDGLKLKCNDGIVRRFQGTEYFSLSGKFSPARCLECGEEFGINPTKYIKQYFKAHVCSDLDDNLFKEDLRNR
jgi:hypothetical protein